MAEKFCRDCRHFRDLEAEQAAAWREAEPTSIWRAILAPPGFHPAPVFGPLRCERKISLVTGEPEQLSPASERASVAYDLCGRDAQFWEPRQEGDA